MNQTDPQLTAEQRRRVQSHLQELLDSPGFARSPRSSAFLRYVVDGALGHNVDSLRERRIGITVFGRPENYDTANDAVVRVRANEIRRRLAQFYGDRGTGDVQIDLPAGSYVPVFHLGSGGAPQADQTESSPVQAVAPGRRRRWLAAVAVLAVTAALALLHYQYRARRGLEADDRDLRLFWQPMLANPRPVILAVSSPMRFSVSDRLRDALVGKRPKSELTALVKPLGPDNRDITGMEGLYVTKGMLHATVETVRALQRAGKEVQVRVGSEASPLEIRQHSLIFVGAATDPFSPALQEQFRFTVEYVGEPSRGSAFIRDRQDPSRTWTVSAIFPWAPIAKDYAIITRCFDKSSSRVLVWLYGVTQLGTEAGGYFLGSADAWKTLASTAPAGWERKNLQAVIETDVARSTPGPARIVAAHFW